MQGERTSRLYRELDHRLDQARGSADHREVGDPLCARIESLLFAVGHRLARDDQHRDAGEPCPLDPHGPLQQARSGMEQNRLHAAGRQGVAGGKVDRQGLVPAVDETGTVGSGLLLVRHRLPYRRPFGARRGEDVVHAEPAARLHERFSAIRFSYHPCSPEAFSGELSIFHTDLGGTSRWPENGFRPVGRLSRIKAGPGRTATSAPVR